MLLKQLVTPVTKRSSFASAIRASSGSVHCSTMVLDVTACWVAASHRSCRALNRLIAMSETTLTSGMFWGSGVNLVADAESFAPKLTHK
jgi:hypothetical protein